jgi:chaperonin GroES
VASESKAYLIEAANRLRRSAQDKRRPEVFVAFRTGVENLRGKLFAHGMPEDEIRDLLPDSLLAPPSSCRLQPFADHVVVAPAKAKTMTEGGLVIPEVAHEVPMRGTVLAVGPGRIEPGIGTRPCAVQVGDEVLFGRYAGVEVTLDDESVRVMREDDIMGTLAPEVA